MKARLFNFRKDKMYKTHFIVGNNPAYTICGTYPVSYSKDIREVDCIRCKKIYSSFKWPTPKQEKRVPSYEELIQEKELGFIPSNGGSTNEPVPCAFF